MTPKEVIAGIAERFLDKPGPNMLASEIVKKLGDAGYVILPKEPTKQMIEDGNSKIEDCIDSWNYDSDSGYSVGQSAARDCWVRMIEVLNDIK